MVQFDLTVNRKQRSAYIPKILIKTLGFKLVLLPDTNAAIIYPHGRDLKVVLRSVEIILQDLKLRSEMQTGKLLRQDPQ
jgi:hypothetical protein